MSPPSLSPGIRARRLVQFGPSRSLQHLVTESIANPEDSDVSVDLLLHDLASEGELQLLQHWVKPTQAYSTKSIGFKPDSFATAALNGHADVVEWMLQVHPPTTISSALVHHVAMRGHDRIVEMLQSRSTVVPDVPVQEAPLHSNNASVIVLPSMPASDAAGQVIQSPVLLSHIYSFRPQPARELKRLECHYQRSKPADDVPGLWMRLALVYGDVVTVKLVHTTAELARFAGPAKLSLDSAKHDAAVEGRVDVLEWLHTKAGVGPCRPDTMAATIRAGWSHAVEWLHTNAPESTLSMSAAPLVDAARWGLLDVLRKCHDLQILDTIAHTTDGIDWRQAALDAAIIHGQVAVVRWFARELRLVGSANAFGSAVRDGDYDMVRALHEENAIATSSVDESIIRIAHLPEMESIVEYVLANELVSSDGVVRLAAIVTQVDGHGGPSYLIQVLLKHYPHTAEPMLLHAAHHGSDKAVAGIIDKALLSRQSLARAFEIAVTEHRDSVRQVLVAHDVHLLCDNALSLSASHGHFELLKKMFSRRTQEQAIAALAQAANLTIASFLLRNELQFYTEAVLLKSILSFLSAAFLRWILKYGRCQDPHKVMCFSAILDQDPAPLTLDEINKVRLCNDPALNAFVCKHYASLAPVEASAVSTVPWLVVHQYLDSIGVEFPATVLDGAITRGQLDEVEWLICECGMSTNTIACSCVRAAASKASHFPVLQFLHAFDKGNTSHGLRTGIRLAYEDAVSSNDDVTAERLVQLNADDLSSLDLKVVAEKGHVGLATTLAHDAPSDAVVEAINRSAEAGHFEVAVAILNARPDVDLDMTLRIRLSGLAYRNLKPEAARALLGVTVPKRSKKRQQTVLCDTRLLKKRATTRR